MVANWRESPAKVGLYLCNISVYSILLHINLVLQHFLNSEDLPWRNMYSILKGKATGAQKIQI